MRQLRPAIVGSQRLYEELGPYRTTAYYLLILGLYVTGAPISTLVGTYRRLTGQQGDAASELTQPALQDLTRSRPFLVQPLNHRGFANSRAAYETASKGR